MRPQYKFMLDMARIGEDPSTIIDGVWVSLGTWKFQGPFTAGKLKVCIEKVVALANNKIVLNAVGDLE